MVAILIVVIVQIVTLIIIIIIIIIVILLVLISRIWNDRWHLEPGSRKAKGLPGLSCNSVPSAVLKNLHFVCALHDVSNYSSVHRQGL